MNDTQPSMQELMEEYSRIHGDDRIIIKTKPCNPTAVLVLAIVVGVIILSAYAIITSRVDNKKHVRSKTPITECTETTQQHP